jgi:hypothetical protein
MNDLIPIERIGQKIFIVRGHKVLLVSDIARLFQVPTFRLNEAVKRNRSRFPEDFCFQLTKEEADSLTSQTAILDKPGRGKYPKYLPYVFTEHGCLMAANILNSDVAIKASIEVVRAFATLREWISNNKELAKKLDELEKRVTTHDEQIFSLFKAIRQLMEPPKEQKRRIGYRTETMPLIEGKSDTNPC